MPTLLDGEKLANRILENLKKEIKEKQLKLKLAVVLLGGGPVSSSYVNKKKTACALLGIDFELFEFSVDIKEEDLKKEIKKISEQEKVSGVVIQLPLPKSFNTSEILNLVPPEKDPDVLSDNRFEKFSRGESLIFPPVVLAVRYLLKEYKISLESKKIILIGKGRLVGKPLQAWLSKEKADFFIADKTIKDLSTFTKRADIIISGAGSPGLVKEEMLKEGIVAIDAGASSEEGKVRGDIDKNVFKKSSFFAPVPGGVGPLTIACLLENLVRLNS